MSKIVAYRRVSTLDQDLGRQLFKTGIHFDLEFSDKSSGKEMKNREGFQECLGILEKGDTLYFHDISRCARNTQQLLEVVKLLTGKGITVVFYKENLEFGGEGGDPLKAAMSSMMLTLLGAVHEFQRTMGNSATKDGLRRAKANGVKLGSASPNYNPKPRDQYNKRSSVKAKEFAEQYRTQVSMMVSEGWSLDRIATKMKQLDLKTSRGCYYTANSVRNLVNHLGIER